MNLRMRKYALIGIIKWAHADFSKGRSLCFRSIFDFICFPERFMYATVIQIRRDAIKMAERYRAEKHLVFQIQYIKKLTIPQNEIAANAIYPAGSKFRWVFSFFMDVFHFSTPFFTGTYIQQQENTKSIFLRITNPTLFLAQNRRCLQCYNRNTHKFS